MKTFYFLIVTILIYSCSSYNSGIDNSNVNNVVSIKKEESLLKSLNKEPNNVNIIKQLGYLYSNKGDYEDSEKYFKKYIEKKPNDLEIIKQLGYLSYSKRNNKDAEKYFKRYIEKKPDDINVLRRLGLLYDNKGDYKNAEKYFKRYIEKKPDDIQMIRQLGYLYYYERDYIKSAKYFENYLIKYPDDILSRKGLVLSLFNEGDFKRLSDKCGEYNYENILNIKESNFDSIVLKCIETYQILGEKKKTLSLLIKLDKSYGSKLKIIDLYFYRYYLAYGEGEKAKRYLEKLRKVGKSVESEQSFRFFK